MAEDHEDPQRGRLVAWADSQGVDLRAKLVFLSLPSDTREAVRSLGQLKTSRNPSATLMARIRQLYPSFVELDARPQCSAKISNMFGQNFRPKVQKDSGTRLTEDFCSEDLCTEERPIQKLSPIQKLLQTREVVRDLGQLKTSRNPSVALMARIRQVMMSRPRSSGQARRQPGC